MRRLAAVVVALLSLSAVAAASPIIDFSTGAPGAGGSVSYAGASGPVIGSSIPIGVVTGTNTPLNSGPGTTIIGGFLDFTTGAYQSYANGTYTFSPGGTFTITGAVPVAGIGQTVLASGTFGATTFMAAQGAFIDALLFSGTTTLNTQLLQYFGFQPGFTWDVSAFQLSLASTGGGGGAFSGLPFATDIGAVPTPEPSTLLLLGTGFLALARGVRRSRRKGRLSVERSPVR